MANSRLVIEVILKMNRFLCTLLCLIFICLSFTPCNTVIANKSESYMDWKQQDERWGDIKINSRTVRSVGCTTVSMAILLMHSGIMKDDFNPKKFVTDYKKAGGYVGDSFKWGVVDSYTNGNFKYKGDTGNGSSVDKIKELYDKGYYVLICMHNNGAGSGMHWIALIDGSSKDPDKIIVADPGYTQRTKTLSEARSSSKNTGKTYSHSYCKAYGYTYRTSNGDADREAHQHFDAEANEHSASYRNPNSKTNGYAETDQYSKADCYPYS